MRKSVLLAAVFVAIILGFCGLGHGASWQEIDKNPQNYPGMEEYKAIYGNFLEDSRRAESGGELNDVRAEYIEEYKKFIKRFSKSEFTDEVKLRIAELYELSEQKGRALPYLNDIIKNHPNADYYPLGDKKDSGRKTADWARYYLRDWFRIKK